MTMFARHVYRDLSAYCLGDLPPGEMRRIADHLARCARCRKEWEEIHFGVLLAQSLPRAAAPEGLWNRIETQLDSQTPTRATQAVVRRSVRLRSVPVLAAVLLIAAGIALLWRAGPPVSDHRPAWMVARLEGAPMIGSDRIGKTGRLRVGEWLVTDARSRARLEVANIGEVEVEPNTRIGLLKTRADEHRLSLRRGAMRAQVSAPPRLFFVETPSAVAVDMGCAYTLTVDADGSSLLRVTRGYVAFEWNGRDVVVPSGAVCRTRPGLGPGTPCFEDAPKALRAALERYDSGQDGADALQIVLKLARRPDSLTLLNLLSRTEGRERARVYDRLAALVPPPSGVTREGALRLDAKMLERWQAEAEASWWKGADFPTPWLDIPMNPPATAAEGHAPRAR
jgi:ferric-dicitrate binding protein FerR (iron transport regulator)